LYKNTLKHDSPVLLWPSVVFLAIEQLESVSRPKEMVRTVLLLNSSAVKKLSD
jgi:hypothetical protein